MTPVVTRWDRSPDLVVHGVSFLLYGLLDVVIDGYFEAVQSFDDYYDDVSAGLFNDEPLSPGNSGTGSTCGARWSGFTGWWSRCGKRSAGSCGESTRPSRDPVPLLPRCVRPRPPGERIDRLAS